MDSVDKVRQQVIAEFSKHWELNDGAHRIGHFAEVEACALEIVKRLGLEHDPMLIMLAAYFHDMFAWSRFNHELMSHQWVSTNNHPIFQELDKESIGFEARELVADACREHRASYDGDFSHEFSELMSSADRGFPGDVSSMVQRSVQYHKDALKVNNRIEAITRAVAHVKEKYGTGGYARCPDLYERAFGKELAAQRRVIDELEASDLFDTIK